MKKMISITLATIMIIGTVTVSYAETNKTYQDVNSTNWAYESISTMSNKGIVKGYPNGSFKPQNTLTYGEFIKMALISATGNDEGNATGINTQSGLKNHWSQNYYDKAIELKYFTEHQIHNSQLGNQIIRSDMALIISSILGDVKIEDYDTIQSGIKDVISKTENEYDIVKAYASGVLTGYTDNTFKPEKTLTRAESAVVIHRLVDESKREVPGGKKEKNPTPTVPIDRDYSSVESISESSNSTLPVTGIASNIYSFKEYNDPNGEALFKSIKYYEIIKDYPFEINRGIAKDGSEVLNISKDFNMGCAMLIKDNKIICRLDSVIINDTNSRAYYNPTSLKLADYDYIAFYSPSVAFDTLVVVSNPYK